MEFVSPWMLFGILAIAIPVIIHLLNRKSARTIDWGAFIFLLDSMMRRRRRVLLEEMLLLASRCLLLALLALALARPFIQAGSRVPWALVLPMLLLSVTFFGVSFAMWRYPKWRRGLFTASLALAALAIGAILLERHLNLTRFGRGAQRDVVLVLDGSASMTMMQGAESNFDRARAEAEAFIQEAPRGTAFGLIVGGPVPQVETPAPVTDRRELLGILDSLQPVQGTMEIMGTLTAAAVMLASGNNPAKQIVVIGDGQAVGWHLDSPDRWKVVASILEQLQTRPQIVWRTLPLPSSIRNLAVTDVALTRDIVGTDRDVGIRVTIENTGSEAVTPGEVQVTIGEKVLSNRSVGQLEGGANHTVTFLHRFERPGTQAVVARVASEDDLPADDTVTHIVHVIDALRVLVVDGNPSGRAFERGSAFLSLSLRPEIAQAVPKTGGAAAATEERAFLVSPEVVDAPLVSRRESFSDCGVVILADVPRLPDETAAKLAQFVANGGGLLIAPGARVQPEFYNRWTYQGEPVLPMALLDFAAASSETNRPALAPVSFSHESLRNLRVGSDLDRVSVARHWRLDEGPAAARVAGRFDNGDPFLAVRRLGRGNVALAALPFDASVSELPSRRSFVPLVHELTYFLANPTTADLNLAPSDGATLLLTGGRARHSAPGVRGIQGLYFPRRGFAGKSVARVDDNIGFEWQDKSPLTKFPADEFSVRWTGSLLPKYSETYEVWVEADDRAKVWVDGKQERVVKLRSGHAHDLRVDFEEDSGLATARLVWKSQSQGQEVVPKEQLLPVRPALGSTEAVGEPTEVRTPGGTAFTAQLVQTADGLALRIARSLVPGVYHMLVPAGHADVLQGLVDEEGMVPFSVKAGVEESDMAALSPENATFLRQYIDLLTATQAEDVHKALVGQAFGKEIWRTLAYAALLFLVLEIFLTRWIAIQRRTGVDEQVSFEEEGATESASFQQQLSAIRGNTAR